MRPEKMSEFFAVRSGEYDRHMLQEVEGCKEGYIKMAESLPGNTAELLDLGCGTGLELDEIFKRNPAIRVTGIDLTPEMLEILRKKHPDEHLNLLTADYYKSDLGVERYDAIVSFQTMHHFSYKEKLPLYARILAALKPGGIYLECDYMVLKKTEAEKFYRESVQIREKYHLPGEERYHLDIPLTIDSQLELLSKAGFCRTETLWRQGNTTLVAAHK